MTKKDKKIANIRIVNTEHAHIAGMIQHYNGTRVMLSVIQTAAVNLARAAFDLKPSLRETASLLQFPPTLGSQYMDLVAMIQKDDQSLNSLNASVIANRMLSRPGMPGACVHRMPNGLDAFLDGRCVRCFSNR